MPINMSEEEINKMHSSWEKINKELTNRGGVNPGPFFHGYRAALIDYGIKTTINPLDPKHYNQKQVYPNNSIKD